jgi:hypothetical protein
MKDLEVDNMIFDSVLTSVEELIEDEVQDQEKAVHGFLMMINVLA